MTPEPIDPPSPQRRALSVVGRVLRYLMFRVRTTMALLAQSLQRDELRELRSDAQALGSAASESISHVGAELREINERLSALERDIDRLGQLLEQQRTMDEAAEKQRQALSRD